MADFTIDRAKNSSHCMNEFTRNGVHIQNLVENIEKYRFL
jgi:hypothetical protein